MVESENLRVGNALFNGKVVSISEDEVIVNDGYQNWKQSKMVDGFDPIHLTEEMLLNRLGFIEVKAKSGVQSAYKKDGVRIEFSNSGNFYYKNKPLPYLHLLQNLYYFSELKGELKIKDRLWKRKQK